MIITILPSSGDSHAVAYNGKKVEKGLAELLFHENIHLRPEAFTADKLRQYFDDYSKQNTRIKNAQFHVSVSCKGTEYTHQQLLEIAKMYLKKMGYAEKVNLCLRMPITIRPTTIYILLPVAWLQMVIRLTRNLRRSVVGK